MKEEIAPLVGEAFLEVLGDLAWRMFGEHWMKHKAVCVDLKKMEPHGLAALARYCTGHLLKRLPKDRITQTLFGTGFRSICWGCTTSARTVTRSRRQNRLRT
jgi:hypothetical protein